MKTQDLYRNVFQCTDIYCKFIFSLLGAQAKYEIEGQCPACGEDVDYATVSVIEKYIKELKEELSYFGIETKPSVVIPLTREGITIQDLTGLFGSMDPQQPFSFSNGVFLDGDYDSYRGHYKDLALSFSTVDHGYNTAGKMMSILTGALAFGSMQGWKGGDYPITPNTLVWLGNQGTTEGSRLIRGWNISYDHSDPHFLRQTITLNLLEGPE